MELIQVVSTRLSSSDFMRKRFTWKWLYVLVLIAVSISCEDKNGRTVDTEHSLLADETLTDTPSDVATCDSEKDPTCKESAAQYYQKGSDITLDAPKSHVEGLHSQETKSHVEGLDSQETKSHVEGLDSQETKSHVEGLDSQETKSHVEGLDSEETKSHVEGLDSQETKSHVEGLDSQETKSHVEGLDSQETKSHVEGLDSQETKSDENSWINKDTETSSENSDEISDSIVTDALPDDSDLKQHETLTSKETSTNDKGESQTFSGNSTSNSSAVVQWFRYIVEQFLEEFKDGIYSKHSEPANTTEANLSVPLVNETVEHSAENTTETVETTNLNTTEAANSTDTKKIKFHCTGRNVSDNSNATVKLITSARLLQLLAFDKNETENMTDCLLVMFYAPWCQFCARTAPHYNAVARAFPQLDFVAVDTAQFSNLLARFGTVSVPNILVFHQSRAAVKFNQTERTFENFVSFIQNATGLEPNTTVNVTEADYLGPIPSMPTDDPDYLLLISWIFVIFCSSFMFVKSQKGQQWITRVRILWQEHQHID